ncbi:MAG: LLM class flavin-dependent oxidoreductase [Sphingomonadaceae bacterium]|nr:LLM class flavin-dependent oxidoreductase [Sphingomonadaceae bacterium]
MRFGVTYNLEFVPEVHKTHKRYVELILEQTVLLEQCGYDAAWYSEHHTGSYSFGNPAVIAAAAAMKTSTIKIGTGVSLLPLHEPVLLAEEFALLDVLSDGRLEYGIGRGYIPHEYGWVKVPIEESHERYHEIADFLVQMWTTEGKSDFHGKHFQIENYECFPKPLQKPFPAIYASAAGSMESYVWAGENGFHLGTALFLPDITMLPDGLAAYRQALSDNGHDPAQREVMAITQMYCHKDHETALREGGAFANNYYRHFAKLGGTTDANPIYNYYNTVESLDLNANGQLLLGCPQALVDKISHYQEVYGLDYIMLEIAQGGAENSKICDAVETFASEVMPHFKTDAKPKGVSP